MFVLFRRTMLGAALLLSIVAPQVARAGGFTPAQRAEIVQIVRQALKADPSILRDAIAALQADEAKRQAEAVLAHEATLVDPSDPVAGNPKGHVTIVEFFDVRCPYCRQLEATMPQLLRKDRDVRVIYKDLPILGPPSVLASRALLAAQRQGGYARLRATLMQAPPNITEASIRAAATADGLDWTRLKHDMDDPAIARRLKANLQLAQALGIDGTPALVIGHQLYPGALDLAGLEQAVAAARKMP